MKMFHCRWICAFLLCGSVFAHGQSETGKTPEIVAPRPSASSPAELEKSFFDIIRNGDALRFLAYVSPDGVNLGRNAQHATRDEIEAQLTGHRGLYCKLFDASCMTKTATQEAAAPRCSYRELLTQSEKVRTASTETTRNNVRQAILVAEVNNQKCGGAVLIDFIFNYEQGGWRLFSVP